MLRLLDRAATHLVLDPSDDRTAALGREWARFIEVVPLPERRPSWTVPEKVLVFRPSCQAA